MGLLDDGAGHNEGAHVSSWRRSCLCGAAGVSGYMYFDVDMWGTIL